jgi:hypothetical protein
LLPSKATVNTASCSDNTHANTPRPSLSSHLSDAPINTADDDAEVNAIVGHRVVLNMEADDTESIKFCILILNQATQKTNEVFHDSGTNCLVFWDKSVFSTYRDINPIKICSFGDNLIASAIGKGTVMLKGSVNGELVTVTLTDVLHIPKACTNLVSHAQLDKKGVIAEFLGSGHLLLSVNSHAIISGLLVNDLYKLDLTPC